MSSVFVNWSSYPSTLFGSLNRAGHHLPAHSKNCNCTHLANLKTKDAKRKYCTKIYKNYVSYPVIQLFLPAHLPIFLKLQLASASTSSASAGSVQRPFLGFEISIGSDDSKILRFLRFPDSLMRSTRALGIFFAPHSSLRLRSLLNPNRTSFTNIYYLSHDVAYIT